MKTGDIVEVKDRPEIGTCKVIRFYANQGTVLVEQQKTYSLTYFDYSRLKEHEGR